MKDPMVGRIVNRIEADGIDTSRYVLNWRPDNTAKVMPRQPPCPPKGEPCKYFKDPPELPLQRNALRIEVGREPTPRCGWRLKEGCIGGSFYDYLPCVRIWRRE